MTHISINGIRLSREMIRVGRRYTPGRDIRLPEVHRALAGDRINMICCGIHFLPDRRFVSCCLDRHLNAQVERLNLDIRPAAEVVTVSVYPHGSDIRVPKALIRLLDKGRIPYFHLVSSHAVVSMVIRSKDQDRVVSLLKDAFSLPDSHTPFRQEIDEDISQFLKKYPETRASYEEERIKTYGINLVPGLDLFYIPYTMGELAHQPERLRLGRESFRFISALPTGRDRYDLFVLVEKTSGDGPQQDRPDAFMPADLISFHGPHFGDRYRILDTALDCLEKAKVPLTLVGCTGASINLVLPAGLGEAGKQALAKGFEAP